MLTGPSAGDVIDAANEAGVSDASGVRGNGAPATTQPCWAFDFERRNRRPPTDPVNALLSFAYALLTRSFAVTLTAVGFDAMRGFYHQPRYGRPALALDMMEPFRPLVADSAVLMAINNGELGAGDFVRAGGAVALNESGRRAFIAGFERRLSQEVPPRLFGQAPRQP